MSAPKNLWGRLKGALSPSFEPLRPNAGDYTAVSIGDEAGADSIPPSGATSPLAQSLTLPGRRHNRRVYWCFWILGAGVLLSWNVLICTMPLLGSFFDHLSSTDLASFLSTAYCVGNLGFLWPAQREISRSSPSPRLRWSLILLHITSLFILFPTLPVILPWLGGSSPWTLPLLIVLTIVLSLSTAYLQCAVFALAALWGPNETLAVMSGQGGIAVLVSGSQFVLAIIESYAGASDAAAEPSTLAGIGLWALSSIGAAVCIYAHKVLEAHVDYEGVIAPVLARRDEEAEHRRKGEAGDGTIGRVFKKNLMLEAAVAWVFVVTLSVFPPITTSILSVHHPTPRLLQPGVFIPLHFVVFNIGDYIGRTYLPAIPALLITNQRHILFQSLARTLFVPVFLACNVARAGNGGISLINSDVAYFLILVVFGLTNGYTSSLCMIVASSPNLNSNITEDEKDVAGTLAVFCLVGGLAGGSAMSFLVSWLV